MSESNPVAHGASLPGGLPGAYSPIDSLLARPVVKISYASPIAEAVRLMAAESVSSVVVIDPATELALGIFTLRDLIRRVKLEPVALAEPIASVMTLGLITLRPRAAIHEAATLMARRRLHHVVIVDSAGRPAGVVTQTDLVSRTRLTSQRVADEIAGAQSIDALAATRAEIDALVRRLVRERLGAAALTELVVGLNDLVSSRIIELTADEFELPDAGWCWIALGSEGRLEQTLATDQDNGLIFDADASSVASQRERFVRFARAVNERLAACGFPLCKGEIMAGNPRWCLSLAEWHERFAHWIDHPQPEALLHASIFFDFRPLYGDAHLAERLRDDLLDRTRAAPLFLRLMSANALASAPALGLIRDFRFDDPDHHPHTIELKMYGSRPFVDAARVLALAHGVRQTSTVERLEAVAARAPFGDDVHAIVDGFWFIQSLRLRNQLHAEPVREPNRVDPESLNEMDRTVLKEALRRARALQQILRTEYRL